jgi:predicted ATPase
LEQFAQGLEQAQTGHGQVVAVMGEPGVGKSRLLWEFINSERVRDALILVTSAASYGKGTPYLPVIDLLKKYFKIEPRDGADTVGQRITDKLPALEQGLAPTVSAVLALLDVPVDDAQWQTLDPPQKRRRTLEAVKLLLLEESRHRQVVLVFEDLHWIDSETQAVLDTLVESLPSHRVLLFVSYRPEYQHAWGGKTYYRQLRIDPLPPESADELLDALLGTDVALAPLKRLLVERTEANPLFLEESVRGLVETGALVAERGAFRLTRPVEHLTIPATVQAILAARVNRLTPAAKRLLQTAAVVGKDVPMPLLLAIVDVPEEEVRAGLARLQAAEFLYETGLFPDLEYTFKHALTHEVAYGGLLHEQQRALHARIAEAIERSSTERAAEHAERLAYHALRGELWEKAVVYLRQAGLRAMARAAYREAITHLEQALAALRHLPRSRETIELIIDIRIELRNALNPFDDRARMEEHLHEAEVLARTLGDQHRLARIATFMVIQCLGAGKYAEAVRFGQEALSIAHTLGDRSIEVVATSFLGMAHAGRGEFSKAITFLERNAALEGDLRYERFGAPAIQSALSERLLAEVLSELGRFDEALEHAEAGVQIAEAVDHPYTLAGGLFSLGLVLLRRGELPRATRVLEQCLDLCRTWQVARVPSATTILGATYALGGRGDEALALVTGAVEDHLCRPRYAARILPLAGMIYLCTGRIVEAASHAREALAFTRQVEARAGEAHALYLAGEVASTAGEDNNAAERSYREAMARAEELAMRPLVAHCYLGLGKLYRRTSQREQAQEHLTIATTMYRKMGMTYWLEQAEAEMNGPG